MQIWMNLVLAVQLITAVTMIGLVLVQHGKGADMGASFGSGASGSLFGATGSANFLSRSTSACAAVFFACTLALAYMSNVGGNAAQQRQGTSVLERAGASPTAASGAASAVTLPAQIPGQVPAVTTTPATPAPAAASTPAGEIPKQ